VYYISSEIFLNFGITIEDREWLWDWFSSNST